MPRNPEVNFYLKPEDKEGRSLIYLRFVYNTHKLTYSFGQRIKPSSWNAGKQRLRNNKQTTEGGDFHLNDLLDSLTEVLETAYKKELSKGVPLPSKLKKHLDDFINQNHNKEQEDLTKPTLFNLIDRFISGEIKFAGNSKTAGTLKNYATAKANLLEYEKKNKLKLNFEDIDLSFYSSFLTFMEKKGMKKNTRGLHIKNIKLFMNQAVKMEYTNNVKFRHPDFKRITEDTESVYLTNKDIMKLYNHDFSENKRLEQARDLFIVGCFTGLRYSDFSSLVNENYIDIDDSLFIKKKTQKTGEVVIIPTNPIILELFEKYKHMANKLPRSISNQKLNDFIKEACEAAGLNDTGRIAGDPKKKLFELVSSHTARRSFLTNTYIEGFPTYELIKISGHSTEKAFLRYIKISKVDSAKRLDAHIKKMWSQKMLKVV